ncbi:MAG: NAD(P)-dependent oxidoreductase [Victivallales bacterium]|nr:NAD(P)-dependent oxidoreductase [Victivallales bacterium]
MSNYLVTGGAGFFGSILKAKLLADGHHVISIDLEPEHTRHDNLTAFQGDINDDTLMDRIFSQSRLDGIFHCAALLAHVRKDLPRLWKSNVDGTHNVLNFAEKYGVSSIVFLSTNCLWARNMEKPVMETEEPAPVEIYGRSKWEAEKILLASQKTTCIIIRCPTIMDEGRLGLLGILFAFIDEGRKVWMVGDGNNKYQFIYAKDLVAACQKAIVYPHSEVFNIGSDNVKSFNEVYEYVIRQSHSQSRLVHLPRRPSIWAMKICFALGISPLGPYQYKMIASSFVFDTSKIKRELHWHPTKNNEEMLLTAYEYYHANKEEIASRKEVSAHSSIADMGIIRLLKWFS